MGTINFKGKVLQDIWLPVAKKHRESTRGCEIVKRKVKAAKRRKDERWSGKIVENFWERIKKFQNRGKKLQIV